MNAIEFIPTLIASLSLAFASFMRNKNWTVIAFVVWLVLFTLTFFVFR